MPAIGRALMLRPRLLILDEPSLGLSPILVKEIFGIIRQINKDGVTILLVEQNAKMALSVSDDALILENGRFVMKGASRDLMEDKDVKEFYLGIRSEEFCSPDHPLGNNVEFLRPYALSRRPGFSSARACFC